MSPWALHPVWVDAEGPGLLAGVGCRLSAYSALSHVANPSIILHLSKGSQNISKWTCQNTSLSNNGAHNLQKQKKHQLASYCLPHTCEDAQTHSDVLPGM